MSKIDVETLAEIEVVEISVIKKVQTTMPYNEKIRII